MDELKTDIIQGFWLSIFTGASRYIHADWLRYDTTLRDIFDIKRLPSQATYSRFFHKFFWERNNEVFPKLQRQFLEQINIGALTIDLDSTVITRYGNQEGAKKGYNPTKKRKKLSPSAHCLYLTNTEASFRFIMMAYNIMALFKHQVLNSNMQLKTLRAYCFVPQGYFLASLTAPRLLDNKSL